MLLKLNSQLEVWRVHQVSQWGWKEVFPSETSKLHLLTIFSWRVHNYVQIMFVNHHVKWSAEPYSLTRSGEGDSNPDENWREGDDTVSIIMELKVGMLSDASFKFIVFSDLWLMLCPGHHHVALQTGSLWSGGTSPSSVTWKSELYWLPNQMPGMTGSVLGLVGLVSIY